MGPLTQVWLLEVVQGAGRWSRVTLLSVAPTPPLGLANVSGLSPCKRRLTGASCSVFTNFYNVSLLIQEFPEVVISHLHTSCQTSLWWIARSDLNLSSFFLSSYLSLLLFFHLFIHLSIYSIKVQKCLLCARYSVVCWSHKTSEKWPLPSNSLQSNGPRNTNKQEQGISCGDTGSLGIKDRIPLHSSQDFRSRKPAEVDDECSSF